MTKKNLQKEILSFLISTGCLLLLSACQDPSIQQNTNSSTKQATTTMQQKANSNANTNFELSSSIYKQLAKIDFKSGDMVVVELNHNQATLNPAAWKGPRVQYHNLDQLNRTSGSNTAFLTEANVASTANRVRQFVAPTGWHSNRPNSEIYNRGHLIAYSLSGGITSDGKFHPNSQTGDQNNLKNLFTQTAYTNQRVQTVFETKVRNALSENKKVIYQATPIFRNNELMARGINLQAISTDKTLNFNVYIFNVQPGYVFNYMNGRATLDPNMYVSFNGEKTNQFHKGVDWKIKRYDRRKIYQKYVAPYKNKRYLKQKASNGIRKIYEYMEQH